MRRCATRSPTTCPATRTACCRSSRRGTRCCGARRGVHRSARGPVPRPGRGHAPHHARGPGVGLAAPQVGLGLAVAVLQDAGVPDPEDADLRERRPLPFRVLVNPAYEPAGRRRARSSRAV
ncbi:peptide deformylase [Oerskovia sp. M15]